MSLEDDTIRDLSDIEIIGVSTKGKKKYIPDSLRTGFVKTETVESNFGLTNNRLLDGIRFSTYDDDSVEGNGNVILDYLITTQKDSDSNESNILIQSNECDLNNSNSGSNDSISLIAIQAVSRNSKVKQESTSLGFSVKNEEEAGDVTRVVKQESLSRKIFEIKKSHSGSEITTEEDSDDFINESEDEISAHLRFEATRTEPSDNRRYKKLKHRKIQSIDQAVVASNYQLIPEIIPEEIVEVIVDKGKKTERLIRWTTQRPNQSTLHIPEEVRSRRGVNPSFRHAKTMFNAWRLFFNDDLLDHIVKCTNENMKRQSRSAGGPFRNYNHDIDRVELIAYFGLLYGRGQKHSLMFFFFLILF